MIGEIPACAGMTGRMVGEGNKFRFAENVVQCKQPLGIVQLI